ncbi:MAG: glucokinase [Spirochaetales bacterium]|nr:glucokinase [Spirochaetales bacterium]
MSTILYTESSPLVIAGDIGGTNTTIALVERRGPTEFSVLEKAVFSSQKLGSIEEGIEQSLDEWTKKLGTLELRGMCLSGAGPVSNNRCQTSNIPWDIDGNEISRTRGLPTLVINDFSAICYGIPLLTQKKSSQLIPLPHSDGSVPQATEFRPNSSVQAVVGAGTGLGIGYLIQDRGHYMALPSEAGHSDFGAYDEKTRRLQKFLHKRIGKNPGAEQFVSGQGIVNIHEFLCSETAALNPVHKEILALPREERAPKISGLARNDELSKEVLSLFVEMYARFSSSIALTFLPRAGLYLAGGIAAKNKEWFLENSRFMTAFLENYKKSMDGALKSIPVFIVDDYGISIPGAALGFFALNG